MSLRVLFTVIPEKGHIHPLLGVAQELQERGHTVAFHAPADIRPQLARAGIARFLGPDTLPPPPDANRGAEFAARVRDAAWLRGWIEELLVSRAPAAVPPLEQAMERFRPDLVVTDPMVYAAALAAHRRGLPWVAVSNSLNPALSDEMESELLDTVAALAPARRALFAREGLDIGFRGCDMLSPWLTVAFTTPAFVGREVPGVELLGAALPRGPRGDEPDFDERPDGRPLVLMSLGSQIYHQPAMFRKVFAAVEGEPLRLLASVSELHGRLGPLPANVRTARYLPQLALLRKARALISHGGANSVMEAAAHGVPLLLSPLCNDQFHQAFFLRRNGMGRVLDLEACPVEACRDALRALLADGPERRAAARIAASYGDGSGRCATLLEELAARLGVGRC